MALKFLNKKGWHTGSLRNIENVWKAEQKHEAEQRKLEELRKQIHEERERAEFRQLQEQAGFAPRQERLDFLYESGLAVGKGSSEGFKTLQHTEASTSSAAAPASAGATSSKAVVPGALFEDKPQSANDAWRKLHSDPLLLIRQKEQEALTRIKSNPVQMAMIRKSIEVEKKLKEQKKKEKHRKKDHKKKHHRVKSKHRRHSPCSSSEEIGEEEMVKKKRDRSPEQHVEHRKREKHSSEARSKNEREPDVKKHDHLESPNIRRNREYVEHRKRDKYSSEVRYSSKEEREPDVKRQDSRESPSMVRNRENSPSEHHLWYRKQDKHSSDIQNTSKDHSRGREDVRKQDRPLREHHHTEHIRGYESRNDGHQSSNTHQDPDDKYPSSTSHQPSGYNNRRIAPKLSQEEREARLKEMQLNAELHEEQRWKRLKKASEQEAQEAVKDIPTGGRNFLDAAQKSIYGTEKGGSSTIEESVRRRTYYLQGGEAAEEKNAFRR